MMFSDLDTFRDRAAAYNVCQKDVEWLYEEEAIRNPSNLEEVMDMTYGIHQ
jgi:hypothetical protein